MYDIYMQSTWYGGGEADPGREHPADTFPLLVPLPIPPLPIDADGIIPNPLAPPTDPLEA